MSMTETGLCLKRNREETSTAVPRCLSCRDRLGTATYFDTATAEWGPMRFPYHYFGDVQWQDVTCPECTAKKMI